MEQIIHMITPGLDSVCSYFYIKEKTKDVNIKLAHVSISKRYGEMELKKLKKLETLIQKHDKNFNVHYIDFDSTNLREGQDAFIRSRNLLIATLIDSSELIDEEMKNIISFGFTKDDRVYDSSERFCVASSQILSEGVSLGSLVRSMSKTDLVRWFLEECNLPEDVKLKILDKTFSCYDTGSSECNACNACFRKSVVLNDLGIDLRVTDEDFLKTRMNILSENIPNERKESIVKYLKNLLDQNLISEEFKSFLGE